MALDYGYTIQIQSNGTSDPSHTPTNQWQRKLSGQPEFVDLPGETESEYVVSSSDQSAKIRLSQTFAGARSYSNELTVTSDDPNEEGWIEIGNFPGDGKWASATIGEDGMIYAAPYYYNKVLKINPEDNSTSLVGPTLSGSDPKYRGAYRRPESETIYFVPAYTGYFTKFSPSNRTMQVVPGKVDTGTGARFFLGGIRGNKLVACASTNKSWGVLNMDSESWSTSNMPTGKQPGFTGAVPGNVSNGYLVMIPGSANQVVLYHDNRTGTAATEQIGSPLPTQSYKWVGGAMAPSGIIYAAPYNSEYILAIDSRKKTTKTFKIDNVDSSSAKWTGAVLAHNGKIYFIPGRASHVLEFDPETETATKWGDDLGATTEDKYQGGVLAPNGKIYCIPFTSPKVLVLNLGLGPVNGKTWPVSSYLPDGVLDPISPLFNKV